MGKVLYNRNNLSCGIRLKERFIHIEYFALRDQDGEYLGILEVSQDLTDRRKLKGEQRLLQYEKKDA